MSTVELIATSSSAAAAYPKPTEDPKQLALDMKRFGYCLIANFLTSAQCRSFKQRIADQALAEREAGSAYLSLSEEMWLGEPLGGSDETGWARQIVQNLINKGDDFLPLLTDPRLLRVVRGALNDLPFYLSSYHGLILKRGEKPQVIHSDQMYVPDQTSRPYVINTMVMLSEFTEANGATRIVPGSHEFGRYPSMATSDRIDISVHDRRNAETIETIPAVGPPGTAMVFEGRLWHGAGENVTGEVRYAMTIYYALAFIRQQECMPASVHDDVYDRMSDDLKALIGFKSMGTIGRVEPNRPGGHASMEEPWPYTGRMTPSHPVRV